MIVNEENKKLWVVTWQADVNDDVYIIGVFDSQEKAREAWHDEYFKKNTAEEGWTDVDECILNKKYLP